MIAWRFSIALLLMTSCNPETVRTGSGSDSGGGDGGGGGDTSTIVDTGTGTTGGAPYGGSPWPAPGIIQAEDFDTGGEGVAYHDIDTENHGSSGYRSGDGVDLKPCSDTSGGVAVGWTAAGEWLQYTVSVTATDSYTLAVRAATALPGKSLHLEVDGSDISGPLVVPVTGWDTSWSSIGKGDIPLTEGTHLLRVVFDTGDTDLDYLKFTQGGGGGVCAGVDCGGHGICQDNGGAATCNCEPGYHASGTTCVADSNPTGTFTVSGGQFIGPDGKPFRARGINAAWMNWPDNPQTEFHYIITDLNTGAPLTTALPGLNFVRVEAFFSMAQLQYADLAAMQPYIDCLTSLNIVVEIECHIYPNVLTGSDLAAVTAWYATFAAHYVNNPYVWFGAQNEPNYPPYQYAISDMNVAIYNAIRGTGNNNIILLSGLSQVSTQDLRLSDYAGMYNIGWDTHYYNWISNYSTDQATNDAALDSQMAAFAAIQSADGATPVIVGEFGDSTSGSGIDPGWVEVLTAVYHNKFSGWAQFLWNTPDMSNNYPADCMLAPPYDGSALTASGQMCKNAIQNGL